MRCLGASRSAFAASSTSSELQRASPQMTEPWTSRATALTDSQSPREAAGNPASITSTPRSASERATRSFSGWVMLQPGDCSPSRSVVSKISTRSGLGAIGLSYYAGVSGAPVVQPRHPGTQLGADLLDLSIHVLLEQFRVVLAAARVLLDPLAGELAVLHLLQDLLHLGLHTVVHHPRATRQIAILGVFADALLHLREAACMQHVHDELQLVQALVVGNLGLIARLDEGFESLHHQ